MAIVKETITTVLVKIWRILKGLFTVSVSVVILEHSLANPQKGKHSVYIRPTNSTPRFLVKRIENICPHILVLAQ
jgi:hypothetical protein